MAGQLGKKLNLTHYWAHCVENKGRGQSWWYRGWGMLCMTSISLWGSAEILVLHWKLFPLATHSSPDNTTMLFAELFWWSSSNWRQWNCKKYKLYVYIFTEESIRESSTLNPTSWQTKLEGIKWLMLSDVVFSSPKLCLFSHEQLNRM